MDYSFRDINQITFTLSPFRSLSGFDADEKNLLLYCQISGTSVIYHNGTEHSLTAGICTVIALHGIQKILSENPESRYTAVVASGAYPSVLLQTFAITEGENVFAPEACKELMKLQKENISESERAYVLCRFFYLMKKASEQKTERENANPIASLIGGYIEANLDKKITLEELSEKFFISKTHIFRLFKSAYGVAPMQYHILKRIESAKKMLTETELLISDIADRLGFTDAKHFSKTFKAVTGELPHAYRNRMKE